MNIRRILRTSLNACLLTFVIMITGVIIWTCDEVLYWNILPDWIDTYAELLVIVMVTLSGFFVAICIVCSITLIAESVAEMAGIKLPAMTRRRKKIVASVILLFFISLFGLHVFDLYRSYRRARDEMQTRQEKYTKVHKELESWGPKVSALFSPEMKSYLTGQPTKKGDQELDTLLKAINVSIPNNPKASILIIGKHPYAYCIISELPEYRSSTQDDKSLYIRRQHLIDIPATWEKEAISTIFNGETVSIPQGKDGVFFSTSEPGCWEVLKEDKKTIGIILLRAEI